MEFYSSGINFTLALLVMLVTNLISEGLSMFSHFSMKLTSVFAKPQRRKANEGVRISNLDPDTRMNSKDEFLQGTNIFMQPVRGVGV